MKTGTAALPAAVGRTAENIKSLTRRIPPLQLSRKSFELLGRILTCMVRAAEGRGDHESVDRFLRLKGEWNRRAR